MIHRAAVCTLTVVLFVGVLPPVGAQPPPATTGEPKIHTTPAQLGHIPNAAVKTGQGLKAATEITETMQKQVVEQETFETKLEQAENKKQVIHPF